MIIHFDPSGTIEGLQSLVAQMTSFTDVQGMLILACDANGFKPDTIDPLLKKISIPLFGGIFPGIIHDNSMHQVGTVVVGLPCLPKVHVVHNLSNTNLEHREKLQSS